MPNTGIYINEKEYFNNAFINNRNLFKKIEEIENSSKSRLLGLANTSSYLSQFKEKPSNQFILISVFN